MQCTQRALVYRDNPGAPRGRELHSIVQCKDEGVTGRKSSRTDHWFCADCATAYDTFVRKICRTEPVTYSA